MHRYRGLIPRGLSVVRVASLGLAIQRLDALARRIPLDAPWTARDAAALDARTVASWLDSRAGTCRRAGARTMLSVTIADSSPADLSEVSLLHLLFHLHSAGGFERQTSIEGGAQQDRWSAACRRSRTASSSELGSRVRLGTPVRDRSGGPRPRSSSNPTVRRDGAPGRSSPCHPRWRARSASIPPCRPTARRCSSGCRPGRRQDRARLRRAVLACRRPERPVARARLAARDHHRRVRRDDAARHPEHVRVRPGAAALARHRRGGAAPVRRRADDARFGAQAAAPATTSSRSSRARSGRAAASWRTTRRAS